MAEEPGVEICHGHSQSQQISFASDRFEATATHKHERYERCNINVCVLELREEVDPKEQARIRRVWRDLIIVMATVLVSHFFSLGVPAIDGALNFLFWDPLPSRILGAAILIYLAYELYQTKTHVASWHGAEHMAFAAYEKRRSTAIVDIRAESPVNDQCGTGVAIPVILLIVTQTILGLPWWTLLALAIYVGSGSDSIFDKLARLPGVIQLSNLTQRFVTTKRPGECELLTAKAALDVLITAHQSA